MSDKLNNPTVQQPRQVNCEVCMKEISASNAKSVEVQDYFMYFCGLDCYDQWINKQDEKPDDTKQ